MVSISQCAATAYFDSSSEPLSPQDPIHHNCIVYTRLATGNEWHFQRKEQTIKVKVSGNFQANNSTAVREAVLSGVGIAVSPIWLFGDAVNTDAVKVVLNDYQPTPLPIYAVYRRGRFIPAKVRCFIDFLASELQIDPWVSNYGQRQTT